MLLKYLWLIISKVEPLFAWEMVEALLTCSDKWGMLFFRWWIGVPRWVCWSYNYFTNFSYSPDLLCLYCMACKVLHRRKDVYRRLSGTPCLKAWFLPTSFLARLQSGTKWVEVVIQPVIRLGLIGHFTKSICKMWVRIRPKGRGL